MFKRARLKGAQTHLHQEMPILSSHLFPDRGQCGSNPNLKHSTILHCTKTREHKSPNELESILPNCLNGAATDIPFQIISVVKIQQDSQKTEWDKAQNLN